MRFINFVKDQLSPVAIDRTAGARLVVDHLVGNWETWLQIEVALHILSNQATNSFQFEREKMYPKPAGGGTSRFCDFVIDPNTSSGNLIWIEMKVLLRHGARDLVSRYLADVEKMHLEKPNFNQDSYRNNTGGAVAYSPGLARTFLQEFINSVSSSDLEHFYYITWNPISGRVSNWKQMGSDSSHGRSDDEGILLYVNIL